MLTLTRTILPTTDNEPSSETKAPVNCMVQLRDENGNPVEGSPDLVFPIRSYQKITRGGDASDDDSDGDETGGNEIILPANLFFDTLTLKDHILLYNMYRDCQNIIGEIDDDNWRQKRNQIYDVVYKTLKAVKFDRRAIAFCQGEPFIYPDLTGIGREAHHTEEKTFLIADYKEITAITVMTKAMIPIWGYLLAKLSTPAHPVRQREQFAFEIIEDVLEDGAFERVYRKLYNYFQSVIADIRKNIERKNSGTASTEFILTHNGLDDQMFEIAIMATVVVKRLASFPCFTVESDGKAPDVMVYACELAKYSVDSSIHTMRGKMKTLPKREISGHGDEDSRSIIDHLSRTSSKSMDVPIVVATAVEYWEIDKLLKEYDIPMDVYTKSIEYYRTNGFGVPSITQAMVAVFIGTRFGGSKCIDYLPAPLYQKIVTILQIFLIRNDLMDLAALASAIESSVPTEGATPVITGRIMSTYDKWPEYQICKETFKGYIDRPLPAIGRRTGAKKKQEYDRIDFYHHILKMIDKLTLYSHSENMAPALWDFAGVTQRPLVGTAVQFDERVIQNLCKFLIMFNKKKPTVQWGDLVTS